METHGPHGENRWTRASLIPLLHATGSELTALYARADAVRREQCGDAVPVRSIIEFSNQCANDCLYCGIRVSNPSPRRYRMTEDEIVAAARQITAAGTIVLQAGEMPGTSDGEIADLLRRIQAEVPGLAITLSVGNRPRETYARWKTAGMDRYLLRFETSDPALFARLHPDCTLADRLQCLRDLQSLGVQTGGGFMIGLPGETLEILADNILLCREFDFDMIGIGPYIPNPETPLGDQPNAYAGDPDMFFRAIAVLRLANPDAHIPATTAFDALVSRRTPPRPAARRECLHAQRHPRAPPQGLSIVSRQTLHRRRCRGLRRLRAAPPPRPRPARRLRPRPFLEKQAKPRRLIRSAPAARTAPSGSTSPLFSADLSRILFS